MYRFAIEGCNVAPQTIRVGATTELPIHLTTAEPSTLTSSTSSSSAPLHSGSVRLLRNIAYKGQFLVPFLPTKHLLLVFPNSVECTRRQSLAAGALEKMSCFLSSLHVAAGVAFTVDMVGLCRTSGTAVVTVTCNTTEDTLEVLSAAENWQAQTEAMRMSAVYIRSYPIEVGVAPQLGPADSRAAPDSTDEAEATRLAALLRNHYYSVPLCPVCADRLELNVTGIAEEQPLCACGDVRCHCLRSSACTICQALFESQLSVNNGTNKNGQNRRVLACEDCGQSSDPWVCLICGYVGCSRYQAMHAKDHYVSQRHFFSLNVTTQQVWDYQSDNFVHRVMMRPEANGDMRRIQYESRENPYASGELEEDLLCDSVTDPGLAKKSVNAKYDLKLTGSHAHYATILKNELDSMRQLLLTQRSERASAQTVTPTAARKNPYQAMDTQTDAILKAYHRQSSQAISASLSLHHMDYELKQRKAETEHLEQEVAVKESLVREAIQDNIRVASQLDAAINEQKELLKDLQLNHRVAANLSSRLQSGDGLARVVTVQGNSARASGKPSGKERGASHKSK